MPEDDIAALFDLAGADVVNETCQSLAGIDGVNEQTLEAREHLDGLARLFVRLLIAGRIVIHVHVKIHVTIDMEAASEVRQHLIGKILHLRQIRIILRADGDRADNRVRANELSARVKSRHCAASSGCVVDIICIQAELIQLLRQLYKSVRKADRAHVAGSAHRNIVARCAGSSQSCRVLRAHDERARLRVVFRLAGLNVHNVDLRAHDLVKQQIRAHILLIRLHDRCQIQNRVQPTAAAGGDRLHCVVRLRRAVGDDRLAALGHRVAEQELEFADLVAAKEVHAGKIVALDIEVYAKLLRHALELIKRRREKAEPDTRHGRKERFCVLDVLIHRLRFLSGVKILLL